MSGDFLVRNSDRESEVSDDESLVRYKWMSLPRSRRQLRTLYFKGERHPAMNMANIAFKMKRSPNQVFILLVGETGAGKSSTINYLFGTNIAETSDTSSQTRSTIEYTMKMKSEEWRIPDLTLSFVDSPGFGDTDGLKQDARNVLSIKNFFKQHPNIPNTQNSRSYPNIVMIVLSITDDRVKGECSNFSKMLKGINGINVVDKSNPNLVVVLTHACSIGSATKKWQEEVDKKKKIIKSVVFDHLEVNATVVVQENKPENFELKRDGDWDILPNGDKQPKILFVACKDLLNNIKDEIGHEAIAVCFRSVTDKTVCKGFVSKSSEVDEKEVNEMGKQLIRSLVTRNELDVNETHRIWGLESHVGHGFNIFTDSPTTSISPLDLQSCRIYDCDSYDIQCDTFQSDRQYKENRLRRLNLPVSKDIKYDALRMQMRAGYNKTSNPATTRNLSFSLEHRIGKVVLPEPYALNTSFKEDAQSLPLPYDACDESNLMTWKVFMEKWGSHVIVETYVGGSFIGDVKQKGSQSEELQISTHDVHAALNEKICFLSGCEESQSKDENTKLKKLRLLPLSWSGGNPKLHKANLDDLNGNDWMGWIKSLAYKPAPLLSSVKLYPIHKLISDIDQNRGAEYKKAMDHALKGKLTHQTPVVDKEQNRGTESGKAMDHAVKGTLTHQPPIVDKEQKRSTEYGKAMDQAVKGKLTHQPPVVDKEQNAGTNSGKTTDRELKGKFTHQLPVVEKDKNKGRESGKAMDHAVKEKLTHQPPVVDKDNNMEFGKAMDRKLNGKLTQQPPIEDNRNSTATSNVSWGCFDAYSMVMIPSKKLIRMKDLQTGDKILTVNDAGIITEDKVIAWLHRVETGRYNFLQLIHKFGEFRITQEHVVFRTKNQTPCQAVFLKPGDEIIMVKRNGCQNDFRICQVPILSIEKVNMTGLYAPLTYSGRLIVDGIAVSCYCKTRPIQIGGFDILSPHGIAHFGMMPMRIAHCLGIDINDGKMDKQTGIHQYAKWLMKMFLR